MLAAEVCGTPEAEGPLQLYLNRLAIGYGLMSSGGNADDLDSEVCVSDTLLNGFVWMRIVRVAGRACVFSANRHGCLLLFARNSRPCKVASSKLRRS